jgi:putative spermidine/putrescine transport system ATP-binding protein
MADRVVVMNQGTIEQVGVPDMIYESPASRFVLDFVGQTNFLTVVRDGQRLLLAGQPVEAKGARLTGATLQIALRPERLHIGPSGRTVCNRVTGRIEDIAYEGALVTYEVGLIDGQRAVLRQTNDGEGRPRQLGDAVTVEWLGEDTILIGGD